MTGPDTPSTPEPLTPQEEEVRRLLADARHTGPTPPEVVARLDRVLADLEDEPVREDAVVRLATRRRRTTTLLVAAAAVVVVGIGVGQVVTSGETDDAGDSATGGFQGDADAGAAQEESPDSLAGDEDGTQAQGAPTSPAELAAGDLATLNPRDFGDDVRTTRSQLAALVANGDAYLRDREPSATRADEAAGAACGSGAWGRGSFVPVRYGSTPAVLVFRRARGNTQIADLFLCGSEQPVRSVTLPAP